LSEYYDSSLEKCCEKCETNKFCASWSLYPTNLPSNSYTCRLYDTFRLNSQNKIGFQSGFNQKSTGFGFYSINDQYQLKFFDLVGNYSYLNSRAVYEETDQISLTRIIRSIESSVKAQLKSYLQNSIFKIVVNNINYLRTRQSMIVSFIVVLDPRITNIKQTESLLTDFNYLIENNIGFNGIRIINEANSNSSLLANLSSFACKFLFFK